MNATWGKMATGFLSAIVDTSESPAPEPVAALVRFRQGYWTPASNRRLEDSSMMQIRCARETLLQIIHKPNMKE